MIESPRHERVRAASRLQQRAARSETGLFLLEGPNALREAIAADAVVEAFATEAFLERHPDLAGALGDALEPVGERALAAMSDTVRPQGVVAVCWQRPVSLDDALAGARLAVVLHEVQDPGNLGTILRVADAAGADAVVVTRSSVDPYNPKVVRATTGSILHVPHALGVSTVDAVAAARVAGMQVLAADVSGDDLTALGGALAAPTAWLLGNEARGLDDATLALADRAVRVPIYGRAESMNLATAASVCIYQSAFAHAAVATATTGHDA